MKSDEFEKLLPKITRSLDSDHDFEPRRIYNANTDVGNGSWIFIRNLPALHKSICPVLFGIYWAVPITGFDEFGKDKFGRYAVKIRTSEDIVLFSDEYSVLSEKRLEEFKQAGWSLYETQGLHHPLNLELLQKGRSLVEEERECVWAFMLDGLTEQQACEEYFFTKHIDSNNSNIYYKPSVEILAEAYSVFGGR